MSIWLDRNRSIKKQQQQKISNANEIENVGFMSNTMIFL